MRRNRSSAGQSHEKAVRRSAPGRLFSWSPDAPLADRNRPLNESPALGAEAAYTSPMALIASWEICAGSRMPV
jgi:hypothetical protein